MKLLESIGSAEAENVLTEYKAGPYYEYYETLRKAAALHEKER